MFLRRSINSDLRMLWHRSLSICSRFRSLPILTKANEIPLAAMNVDGRDFRGRLQQYTQALVRIPVRKTAQCLIVLFCSVPGERN